MQITKTTTSDNYIFSGLYSKAQKPNGIIIHIHGMAASIYSNSFYPQMHEKYPENDWSFVVGEHRGSHSIVDFASSDGSVKTCGNTFEIFEDCVIDIQAWIDWAKNQGYTNIWLQGHSLGCSKIAYYLANQKNDIAGAIWLSPTDIKGRHTLSKNKIKNQEQLEEAQKLVAVNKGKTILADLYQGWATLSAQTVLSLFEEKSNSHIFYYPEMDQSPNYVLSKIKIPVIAFSGTNDGGVVTSSDPYMAMAKLEKALVNSPKAKTCVFEGSNHGFKGFDAQIVSEVLNFLQKS
jgi:predicted alpha/beta-fold hydrolase